MVAEQYRNYKYNGEMKDLIFIVEKTINQMNLVIKNKTFQNNFFQYKASEKMMFISINWPINFEITANQFENFIMLEIKTWSNMFSLTQDSHSNDKANEFLSYIQTFSSSPQKISEAVNSRITPNLKQVLKTPNMKPNISEASLETLKKRYKNGEITKEEYKKLKKELQR